MTRAFVPPHVARARRPDPRFWVLVFRCYRVVVVAATTSFALVGALVTPPYVVLLLAPLWGFLVAGVVGLVNTDFPQTRSARRTIAFAGTGATLLVPALAGIGALPLDFGHAMGVYAAVGSVAGAWWAS